MAEAVMKPRLFKVFGLQRSGTNLAQHLVETNFHAECLNEISTGWKHGPLRLRNGMFDGEKVCFVLCVKNPYAWIVSCYRFFQRSVGGDPTMAPQFSANPRMTLETFVCSPHYAFESPVHRWNVMHRLWLSTLPADRTVIVRQEDQLDDQRKFLSSIQLTFKFRQRFEALTCAVKRVDVDRAILGQMDREYYCAKRFVQEYPAATLAFVTAGLDRELMEQFSYSLESD